HVWKAAQSGEPPEVEIVFPYGNKEKSANGAKIAPARRFQLADACGESEDSAPDLVLLKVAAPLSIPQGVIMLQLATKELYEVGKGRARTFLPSRGQYASVDGTVDEDVGPNGLRQFHGDQKQQYWFEKGSSGSPVFVGIGQQLADIVALSELGANEGQ